MTPLHQKKCGCLSLHDLGLFLMPYIFSGQVWSPKHSQRCFPLVVTPSIAFCIKAHLPFCCSPSLPFWDGFVGSPFGLPPLAVCVPYLRCILTTSSPMYQLCGAVHAAPYHDALVKVCSASLYHRWVSLSTGTGDPRFSQGHCHRGPMGSECSFVLLSL